MALADVEAVLASLYVDRSFRARFFDRGPMACPESSLTPAETRQLAALDRRQVELYAESLERKRLQLARELLPAAAAALGSRFRDLFAAFCDAAAPAALPVEEAARYVDFLLAMAPAEPPFLADVLACERIRLEVKRAETFPAASHGIFLDTCPVLSPAARVAHFAYDLAGLYSVLAGGRSARAERDPSYVLIGRVVGTGEVRMRRMNDATACVLRACDGTRSVAEISAAVAQKLGLDDAQVPLFAEESLSLLNDLARARLLS